jgi:hypothetical protein
VITDRQRAEVAALEERGDVPPFERGRLVALRRAATGDDLRRIDALLDRSPRSEPEGEVRPVAIAAGERRARNWRRT